MAVEGGGEGYFGAVFAFEGFRVRGELGHFPGEGAEVVDHGLVDEDITVGEEEDAFFASGFPEAPDDLKSGVGFAGAGGHDEEDAILAGGDGFNRFIDGSALIVAGGFGGAIVEVVLEDDLFSGGAEAFPGALAGP